MVRLSAVLLPLIATITAPVACAEPATGVVTPAELRARIAVLADDGFEGRKPGTPGGAKTEAYIVDAFTRAGLVPAGVDGFRQPVALATFVPAGGVLRVTNGDRAADVGPGDIVLLGDDTSRTANGALWFIGDGSALGKADLKGAIVLTTLDQRPSAADRDLGERREQLAKRGVAAAIFVVVGKDWTQMRGSASRGVTRRVLVGQTPVEGFLNEVAADRLLAVAVGPAGVTLVAATPPVRLAAHAHIRASTTVRRFTAANIIGRVAGSDPEAGAVVITAHWDHLGLCRPGGTADRICNGANDNGSGVAMLIEVGRRLAAGQKPVRDVYFVATTAEEMGELGAAAFADAPPVPINHFVAGLNLDTAVIGSAGLPVAIMGRGRYPALDRAIDATVRHAGRTIDTDNDADVMLRRQDGWVLSQAGVPAVMVSGSFSDMKRLMAYLGDVYHQPADDMAHLGDLTGAAEDATLHVALARALADPATYPFRIR